MTALLHRHHETPAPSPVCGSDAYYWVITDASLRLSCGPHLEQMLEAFRDEHGQTSEAEPPPGSRCEWAGGSR